MKNPKKTDYSPADVIPIFGRDEMNLIEFPFGPITAGTAKTFEVEHPVIDPKLKRLVNRNLLITGSDAFGLPKPIDDQVLMGMKALTCEAGFQSKTVHFSRYHLCRTLGWPPDGRSYKRLEDAMDRIAGTTLKFKDAWWDKGESEWTSKTFHLIEEVSLCSRDQLDRKRLEEGRATLPLCSFVWSDVIWKSFQDGFIRKLDMVMWRKIASGRRREVPLRLYRILGKRFFKSSSTTMKVRRLCVGTLGICSRNSPSQLKRILQRAADWLIECGYLREARFQQAHNGELEVVFIQASAVDRKSRAVRKQEQPTGPRRLMQSFGKLSSDKQIELMDRALAYCKKHRPDAFLGYQRNQKQAGPTFESYREQVLQHFWKSWSHKKSNAA